MAPSLTLHQGENKRELVEHPTETARKIAERLMRFAAAFPDRGPIPKGGE